MMNCDLQIAVEGGLVTEYSIDSLWLENMLKAVREYGKSCSLFEFEVAGSYKELFFYQLSGFWSKLIKFI